MNADLDSTLAAIDAATGCQQCEGPLGDSPSDDFCSDLCQEDYFASRCQPLVDYREPVDLPQHIYNQHEESSPETTPLATRMWDAPALSIALTGNAYFQVIGGEWTEAGIRTIHELRPISFGFEGVTPTYTVVDEVHHWWQPSPLSLEITVDTSRFERAIAEAQEQINRTLFGDLDGWRPTGILQSITPESFSLPPEIPEDLDFDYEWKPVPFLADEEPLPPVMPASEQMQAAIDRYNASQQEGRFAAAPRGRINPRGSR